MTQHQRIQIIGYFNKFRKDEDCASSAEEEWFDKWQKAKKANDPKKIRHAEAKLDAAQNKVGDCTMAYSVIETVLTLMDYKLIVDDDGLAVDIVPAE